MKNLLISLLTAACVMGAAFTLAACGGSDGKDGTDGTNGKDGKDGVGITDTEINGDGELVITLSDGTVKNVGVIVGSDGVDGIDGDDGVGINNVEYDADGNLKITLTEGEPIIVEMPEHSHSYGEWETVLEADCTSIGVKTHECTCGKVEYDFIAASDYDWVDGIEFSEKILKTCTECGATKIEDKVINISPLPDAVEDEYLLPIEDAVVCRSYEEPHWNEIGRMEMHMGIDFAIQAGASVRASLTGNVKTIVSDNIFGENYVEIEHADGIITVYKYIVANKYLKVGYTVNQGDIIGTVAADAGTEISCGEHLHFEVKINNEFKNPAEFLGLEDSDADDE